VKKKKTEKKKTKKKIEFTTDDHYVECSNCGPIKNIRVNWAYVRNGGICRLCRSRNIMGTLKEILPGKKKKKSVK